MDMRWIFDPLPPSGARTAGLPTSHVINPDLDTFIREVVQNSHDQRIDGQKAGIRFSVEAINGEDKEDFLESLGWIDLSPHLEGAADLGGITIGPQLRAALRALDDRPLALLRIDDWNTRGLFGGEDAESGNFAALCRHTLITDESLRARGGSFGLGKSVLWRFSQFSTVLFCSSFRSNGGSRLRFIGRSELPFHRTGEEEWAGSGWYGQAAAVGGLERAESVWDADAEEISRRLRLARTPDMGTGTSILIVGFFEPRLEGQPTPADIADRMRRSAAAWFWPSIDAHQQTLTVQIHHVDESGERHELTADLTSEILPFVQARNAGSIVPVVKDPGDVAERKIPFRIPAKTEDFGGDPEIESEVILRLRLAGPDQRGDLSGRIALMRGAGFVVRYVQPGELLTEVPFHAVLLAGMARGREESDVALDAFLRAAEPVSHNDWIPGTDRLKAQYRQGAAARLRELMGSLARASAEMCEIDQPNESQGPAKLRELFPLRGRGGGLPPEPSFRVRNQWAVFREGCWHFGGLVSRTARTERRWELAIILQLEGESGLGELLPIESISTDVGNCTVHHGKAECVVSRGTREVRILEGRSTTDGAGNDLLRTPVRLTIRPRYLS